MLAAPPTEATVEVLREIAPTRKAYELLADGFGLAAECEAHGSATQAAPSLTDGELSKRWVAGGLSMAVPAHGAETESGP